MRLEGGQAAGRDDNGGGSGSDDEDFNVMLQDFLGAMNRDMSWRVEQPRFASAIRQWTPQWLVEPDTDSQGRRYDAQTGYESRGTSMRFVLPCIRCGGSTALEGRNRSDSVVCSMVRLKAASPWLPEGYGDGVESLRMGTYGKCHRCRLVVGIG